MKRRISTRRVFYINQYQTYEAIEEITDIPEELAFDVEFINNIHKLQNISVEERFKKYLQLSNYSSSDELDLGTVLETLSDIKKATTNNLLDAQIALQEK